MELKQMRLIKKSSLSGIGTITSNLMEINKLLEEIEVAIAEMVPNLETQEAKEYIDSLYSIYDEIKKMKQKSDTLEEAYDEKKREYQS
jgi:Mg2+ and Co2+ transporter CorA